MADDKEKITRLFGADDSDDSDDSDLEYQLKGNKGDGVQLEQLSESSESEDEQPRKRMTKKKVTKIKLKRKPTPSKGSRLKQGSSAKKAKKSTDAEVKDGFIASDDDNQDVLESYNAQKEYESEEDPYGDEDGNGKPEEEVDVFQQAVNRVSSRGRNKGKKMSFEEKREYCNDFVEKMAKAADADQVAAAEDRPALAKLKMLDEVVKNLSDLNLQITFLEESDMLAAIRMWLQPLKATGALPNVMVRKALIDILPSLPVYRELLLQKSDAAITKVVNYLREHPKETNENKKKLQALFHRWCRMIYNKTANFRELEEMQKAQSYRRNGPTGELSRTAKKIKEKIQKSRPAIGNQGLGSLAKKTTEVTDAKNPNMRARAPQPMVFDFKYRPSEEPRLAGSSSVPTGKPKEDNYAKKLERKMKTLRKPVQKNKRAVKLSIEGRG